MMKFVVLQYDTFQDINRGRRPREEGKPRTVRTIIPTFGIQDALDQVKCFEHKFSGTKETETYLQSRRYEVGAEIWQAEGKLVLSLSTLVSISEEFKREVQEGVVGGEL